MGRAALPELQCWLGATWLSSLYKAFLFLGRFSIPRLFITAASLSTSGGLLKVAEFSSYCGRSPHPKFWQRRGAALPPLQSGPGQGPSTAGQTLCQQLSGC